MILALDSSGTHASIALVDGATVVREISEEVPRGRGAALFVGLEKILTDAAPLTRIVVGTGPGSYNGIRSAVAAAWGMAWARGLPLVGVSSLLGLAEGRYGVAGDARRGQYYFAMIDQDHFEQGPVLLEKDGLLEVVRNLGAVPLFVPRALEFLPEAITRSACVARLAQIGARQDPHLGIPEPLYLKPAYINLAPKTGRVS